MSRSCRPPTACSTSAPATPRTCCRPRSTASRSWASTTMRRSCRSRKESCARGVWATPGSSPGTSPSRCRSPIARSTRSSSSTSSSTWSPASPCCARSTGSSPTTASCSCRGRTARRAGATRCAAPGSSRTRIPTTRSSTRRTNSSPSCRAGGFELDGGLMPVVLDTPWAGAIDAMGGVSLKLYDRLSRWKRDAAVRRPGREHRVPRPGPQGAAMSVLGLLPAIRGGLGELARTGQHARLVDGYLRPYARAFDAVRYFSYLPESLATFTTDRELLERVTAAARPRAPVALHAAHAAASSAGARRLLGAARVPDHRRAPGDHRSPLARRALRDHLRLPVHGARSLPADAHAPAHGGVDGPGGGRRDHRHDPGAGGVRARAPPARRGPSDPQRRGHGAVPAGRPPAAGHPRGALRGPALGGKEPRRV